jgi:predicted DNA-binding transcriptional regulator YafY
MDRPTTSNPLPSARPRLRRLLAYREWLTAGRSFTAADAAAELEVSERTVLRDMEYARTLKWDVDFCRKERGWKLGESGAPLALLSLTEGELIALIVAQEALRAYAGTTYAGAVTAAFAKITALLDTPVTLDPGTEGVPHFTGPPVRPVELRQYVQFAAAQRERRRLSVRYYSPERDEETERCLDPYHLLFYAGDRYVIGFDSHRKEVRTFALGERMREVRETGERFTVDPGFDLAAYQAAGFGLFRGGTIEDVALRFSRRVAHYAREKSWFDGETKEGLPDGGLLLRMRVPVNVGVVRFVLQWGAEVEVVEPARLREQVAEELRQAAERYGPPGASPGVIP